MGGSLEIIGADEFDVGGDVGDDDDYEVGADDLEGLLGGGPRRRRGGRGGGRGGGRNPYARESGSRDARSLLIGFQSLAIPIGGSVVVEARPQMLFRPVRLVIGALVAPSFAIDDIKIGNRSQFIAAGSVPAEAFAQNAVHTPLKMDTCQISMSIILQVHNVSAAIADFRAAMFGDAVY